MMSDITTEQVRLAIQAFMQEKYQKKAGSENKNLEKAKEQGDHDNIATIEDKLQQLKQEYQFESWLEKNLETMCSQLKFGTHISKGVHSSSKGGNAVFLDGAPFEQENVDDRMPFAGSQSMPNKQIDIVRSASYSFLAKFFKIKVDAESGKTIYDLLWQEHEALVGIFSSDKEKDKHFRQRLHQAVKMANELPITDERNKQILWPLASEDDDVVVNDHYVNLIPLHPSVLSHYVANRVWSCRDKDTKEARENRFNDKGEAKAYIDITSLAFMKLGGTKPQNVSMLTQGQSGKNYLLPSLPPHFNRNGLHFSITARSFFNKRLRYLCEYNNVRDSFMLLVKSNRNNKYIRDLRKSTVDSIIERIAWIADDIRTKQPLGWSESYSSLNIKHKHWLDRCYSLAELEEGWEEAIASDFSRWLNQWLKEMFPEISEYFADVEYLEWKKSFIRFLKQTVCRETGYWKE